MVQPARWRFAAALAAGLLCAGPAAAADPAAEPAASPASEPPADPAPTPTPGDGLVNAAAAERIRAEAARLVPAPWRVLDVAIEPLRLPTLPGDAESRVLPSASRVTARVAARVALGEPTFLVDSREGPVTFVRPAADPSLEKTLTATAVATRNAAGAWTVRLDPNNPEVFDGVGRPAAELPGRVIPIGSEEERRLRAEIAEQARRRVAEEEARLQREQELLARQSAAAKLEAERLENERRLVEARAAQITDLRSKLAGEDRSARLAAYEAALGGNDAALRQVAVEAALRSRDPVLANLALKDWLARKRQIPVQLFATKEDRNSETVLHNLGPLTIEVESFNRVGGAVTGRMGAPGYNIAMPSAAVGALAQTELALNSYGCALNLRLTEHQTLDGLFRCQTLPPLIARVTLD